MATKRSALFDLSDFTAELAKGLKSQAVKPNIIGYTPHDKQMRFHTNPKKGRLYIGGNRSGKSYGSVAEDIWWLTGTHPYIKTPEVPVRGRVVTTDFIDGLGQIMIPLFKQLLAPSMLIGGSWEKSYNKSERLLTLANGSTLQFMSYEQDTEKFAGTSLHFVHFDEEPPMHIFNECGARLIDTDGNWWVSMTPVEGLTWTYEKLFKPGAENDSPLIGVIEADMLDNPHLSAEAAENYLSGLDDEERKAREHGTYVQLGGLVYKQFAESIHVIDPFIPPKDWLWYCSVDHGYNNPTAVLWHAVSPEGYTVTFGEHYEREWTLDQHAAAIHERNKQYGKVPDYYVGDPAIAQRSAHFGTSIQTEYAIRGIPIALGNNNVEIGVAKVQGYLRFNPETKKPNYQITKNCAAYVSEMKKLRWKTYASKKMQFTNNPQEGIHKKDDHACDSARYFFSFLPDLAPYQMVTDPEIPEPPKEAHGGKPVYGTIDDVLAKMVKSSTPNTRWSNEVVGTDLQGLEYD